MRIDSSQFVRHPIIFLCIVPVIKNGRVYKKTHGKRHPFVRFLREIDCILPPFCSETTVKKMSLRAEDAFSASCELRVASCELRVASNYGSAFERVKYLTGLL